jgi:trigger factor
VVELADTPDLGSGGASRGGSSPSARTSLRVRPEGFFPVMQVTETLSEGLKRGFTIVVPASDLEARRQAKLAELARGLRLPGFRPGKVPTSVVRQRYGSAVIAEVLQESVSEATDRVVADRGLRPAVPPKVDVVAPGLEQGAAADLEFKVELELLPDIKIPDFSAIYLTRLKAEPDETAIAETLERIATSSAAFEPVTEERGAAKGEVLTTDFAGEIDGQPFSGGNGTAIDVEVGGGAVAPGFSDQLEGMRPGETRTVTVTYPADHGVAELAGKEARFQVTASKLARRVVPPVDDALAEKLGFETLDRLKDAVRQQMQQEYDGLARLRLKRALLDALAAVADFSPPEGLVSAEFDAIWKRVEAERDAGRAEPEDAAKDVETLKAEYRAIAERRVKLALLLAEVGRTNGITVSEEEVARALRADAARYRGHEAQVLDFYRRNPRAAEGLRGPILEDKVVDFVLELSHVTDQTVTPDELLKEPPAEAEAA